MPQSLIRQPICYVQCRLIGVTNGALANVTALSACHQHQTILNISDEYWHRIVVMIIRIMISTFSCRIKQQMKLIAAIDYHQYTNFVSNQESWKNEKSGSVGYYRAWIRSIEGEMCRIVFVDYGNECDIERSRLFSCPSSVSCLPWLAIRVRSFSTISFS